jgi:hypothetical protein
VEIVKEKDIKKDLPPGYTLLASVLREGKQNSLTTTEIIKALGWNSNDKRNVMHIVEQLITKHGFIIGSSRRGKHKGYYLIATEEEYRETMQTYSAQINSMLKRHKKLQENYIKKDQLCLEVVV